AVVFDDVEDRVGERPHYSASDRVLHHRVGSRVLHDQGQRTLDGIDEPAPEAGFLALIPTLGGVHVSERGLAEHQGRAHRRVSLRLASSQLITASGFARWSSNRRRSSVRCSSEIGRSAPSSTSESHSVPMRSSRSLGASRSACSVTVTPPVWLILASDGSGASRSP